MKYITGGILALIGTGIWTGSFYISPDIQYQAIYGFLKILTSSLGFVVIIWLGIKIHGNDDYYSHDNYRYSDKKKSKKEKFREILKSFGVPIFYLILIIGIQMYIWKSDFVESQIAQTSHTISDHITFPGDGNAPRFYIGEKPIK